MNWRRTRIALGVHLGQIAGAHTVCFLITTTKRCVTGPASFSFSPPAYVRSVTIRTP